MDVTPNEPLVSPKTTSPTHNVLYWLLFVFAGIESFIALIFIIFVIPQITAVTQSLGAKRDMSSTIYLAIIFSLCIVQIAYGFWLRSVQKQRVLKEREIIIASVLFGGSLLLFSWLIGGAIISVMSSIYQLTSSIK